MKPSRVRRVFTDRLAYLSAKLAADLPPRKATYVRDEVFAIRTALTKMGLLDEENVEHKINRVVEVVLPAETRRHEENRRARDGVAMLLGETESLALAIHRAARVT